MVVQRMLILFLVAAVGLLSGCGGGSGSSAPAAVVVPPAATLTVRVSLQGPLAPGAAVGSVDVTLILPPGVTVRADSNGQALDGVVTASGVAAGSLVVARYTAADPSQRGRVRLLLINAKGFGVGEMATVQCDLGSGSSAAASDCTWAALGVTDGDSKAIRGLAAQVGP